MPGEYSPLEEQFVDFQLRFALPDGNKEKTSECSWHLSPERKSKLEPNL